MTPPIFVISLASASDRRERFLTRAKAAEIQVEIVDAHTSLSNALTYKPEDALVAKGRTLHSGELGVYSSHYAIWARMVQNNIDRAFVFEDDAVVDWTMLPELFALPDQLKNISYLRLFAKRPCRMKVLSETLSGGRSIVDYRGYAYGAQAYLIRRPAAQRLLDHCRRVRLAIDDEMDRSWEHGIPNLAVFPFPCFEENVPSTIGLKRFNDQPSLSPWSSERVHFRFFDRIARTKQFFTRVGLVDNIDQIA